MRPELVAHERRTAAIWDSMESALRREYYSAAREHARKLQELEATGADPAHSRPVLLRRTLKVLSASVCSLLGSGRSFAARLKTLDVRRLVITEATR